MSASPLLFFLSFPLFLLFPSSPFLPSRRHWAQAGAGRQEGDATEPVISGGSAGRQKASTAWGGGGGGGARGHHCLHHPARRRRAMTGSTPRRPSSLLPRRHALIVDPPRRQAVAPSPWAFASSPSSRLAPLRPFSPLPRRRPDPSPLAVRVFVGPTISQWLWLAKFC